MQRDYWYDVNCQGELLMDAVSIGQRAAERAARRLGSRPVPTCEVPVLFSAELAGGLFGSFLVRSDMGCGSTITGAQDGLDAAGSTIINNAGTSQVGTGREPRRRAARSAARWPMLTASINNSPWQFTSYK